MSSESGVNEKFIIYAPCPPIISLYAVKAARSESQNVQIQFPMPNRQIQYDDDDDEWGELQYADCQQARAGWLTG
jgi:hypothetical protein